MKRSNGSVYGLLSGMLWGLDSVLIGVVLATPLFMSFGNNGSLISTFIHDGVSFMFLLLIMAKTKVLKEFKEVLFSKAGRVIILAALLGGPIGMTGYILSINTLGASVASGISAIYPVFGLILSALLLKERLGLRSILGIILSMSAIMAMGLTSVGVIPNLGMGIIFALICVVGWGSEAVLISVALKENVSSSVALGIRQFVTFVTYGLVIMPIIGYSSLASIDFSSGYTVLLFVTGLVGTTSYLCYYKSIELIGPGRAMGLNISYPAWAFIFSVILFGDFVLINFVFVIIIVLGSIMSSEDPRSLLPEKFRKKR